MTSVPEEPTVEAVETNTPVAGPSSESPDNPEVLTKAWTGAIQWRQPTDPPTDNMSLVGCNIFADQATIEDLKMDTWSEVLRLFLLPEEAFERIGRNFFEDPSSVVFNMSPSAQLNDLTRTLESGMVGFIRLKTPSGDDVYNCLVLLYTRETNAYEGFVPNDQLAFIIGLENLIKDEQTRLLDIMWRRNA